ncbi:MULTISPECIES: hypothetical protein [Actinomadura]|uniref:Integral membrane protein n=1 Tax=Actinomadura yumaensis TaxID=111807 RepID=A0ABW2CHI3_9ACTN|nr:hypothetical protein [Actinomadura sp. J1-007]MWK39836.1 hypothetical protein [Actinomadura sp. J1-007]
MTAPHVRADPIEEYLTDLSAALHGPARAKARMVGELREGLMDAAADLSPEQPGGQAYGERATRQAIGEFGTVAELAPHFQRELTIAQTRHTAGAIALLVPLLFACWNLAEITDGSADGRLPGLVQTAAAHLGGVAAATALLGAACLAATGTLARRVPTPRRLPAVMAWTGTTAATALAISALTLTVASLLVSDLPMTVLAGALTFLCHAKIAASARLCRHCARLSPSGAVAGGRDEA